MIVKHCKQPVLVLVGTPKFICKEANKKHNEITLVLAQYAMPLNHTFTNGGKAFSLNLLEVAVKASKNFQDTGFTFNNNPNAPAFVFQVKARTTRRGDDTPNQELANKIVMAKANAAACRIANRILKEMGKYYYNEIGHLGLISNVLDDYCARELAYIHKI